MNAARKTLEAALEKAFAPVKEQTSDSYREAVDLLRGFARQVAGVINQPGGVTAEVKVELGHLVNQGQEHRVALRAPEIGLSDYLLRAFIPADGYPVVLDMFAEGDRACDTPESLVAALVELSEQPAMQQRLASIRSLLSDEALRDERGGAAKAGKAETRRAPKGGAAKGVKAQPKPASKG